LAAVYVCMYYNGDTINIYVFLNLQHHEGCKLDLSKLCYAAYKYKRF